jgi:hypothetical protein
MELSSINQTFKLLTQLHNKMDLETIDAITAGLVVLVGVLLAVWSTLIYIGNKKIYTLLIAALVFFFSLSYGVIPFSYLYLMQNGRELPLIGYMIVGYTSLPLAVLIAGYMGMDIFFPKYKKQMMLFLVLLSIGYYIALFGFPDTNIIRHRPTKAEVVGIALIFMSLLLVIAILIQTVGFYQLRKREETKPYHQKMFILIIGWFLMLIASMFDTAATEPWQLYISRSLTCLSLYFWYRGYSPDLAVSDSIEILAPIDHVWNILTDVDKYPEWNSFTPRVSTSLKVGEEFTLDCQMTPTNLMKNVPEVMLEFDPQNYILSWGSSRTKRKGVTGDRKQELIQNSPSITVYRVREQFTGPLASLVIVFYARSLQKGFANAAQELKKRAESTVKK